MAFRASVFEGEIVVFSANNSKILMPFCISDFEMVKDGISSAMVSKAASSRPLSISASALPKSNSDTFKTDS